MSKQQLSWLAHMCPDVVLSLSGETSFSGLALDSRQIGEADLFFALPGQIHDGIHFVEKALQAGAVAIVAALSLEEVRARYEEFGFAAPPAADTPWVQVENPWHALGRFAQALYGYPDRELKIIAVTGTDGKSSTSYYLYQMLAKLGVKAGLISTVFVDDGSGAALNTVHISTPQAPDLFAKLRSMVEAGYTHVVLETTSHALDLGRLGASKVDVAVFTNLGRDHLEHHKTMENYFAAKKKLFASLKPEGTGIAMAYCSQYQELRAVAPRMLPARLRGSAPLASCETGDAGKSGATGASSTSKTSNSSNTRKSGNAGEDALPEAKPDPASYSFVDENRALAVAAVLALQLPSAPSLSVLEAMAAELEHPKGRLQEVKGYEPVRIIIDYCHTPAAYKLLLPMMRRETEGRLLILFGSAGERDTGKRQELGREADLYADEIWLTDEDPRGEDSVFIFSDIRKGITRLAPSQIHEIRDRREAVGAILSAARPGDTVLLLGKGHEIDIKYDGYALPYNEQEVVEDWLRERKNQPRTRVGFFYGGASTEHAVARRSAATMCRVPNPERYELIYIGIALDGRWYLQEAPKLEHASLSLVEDPARVLTLVPGRGIFMGEENLDIAVAFPMLHGTHGEDGAIQGTFLSSDIAYMGASLDESALAMNKVLAKRVWAGLGLPVVPSCAFNRAQWNMLGMNIPVLNEWVKTQNYPYFIKPARGGSSVGISRATNIQELVKGIEEAFQFDSLVMIEVGLDRPHELEFAIVGDKVYHPGEIENEQGFYSYEEKYSAKSAAHVQPRAILADDVLRDARKLAKAAYDGLGIETFSRVDLFLDKSGELFINEINTLPGMTSISLFPQIIQQAGDKLEDSFDEWISQAEWRFQNQKDLDEMIRRFGEGAAQ